ncbi:MAG TPA: DUF2760 domain-containing protein [Gemmataceae bacterium]|nr:DUF2760 domain-containing protein [Gemmataceae bacterium]
MEQMLPIIAIAVAVIAAGAAIYLFMQLRSFTNPDTLAKLAFFCGNLGDRLFKRVTADAEFRAKIEKMLDPKQKPSGEALRLLALLQREGRLLDFLLEDVQAYGNDQIGAAVRDIHKNCQKAIRDHVVLEPVLKDSEGATVQIPAGFDPSAVRLTGNVTGQPPFKGTLQHHGWRVKELKLAAPPEGQDEFVLQPAEVELP